MNKKHGKDNSRQQLKEDINILKTFISPSDKEDQFDTANSQQSLSQSGKGIMSLVFSDPNEYSLQSNNFKGGGLNQNSDESMTMYGQADPELLFRKNRIDTSFKNVLPEGNFVDETDQIEDITETTKPKKMQVSGHNTNQISSNFGYTDPRLLIRKNRIDTRFTNYIPEASIDNKAYHMEHTNEEIQQRGNTDEIYPLGINSDDNTYIPSKSVYDYNDEPIQSFRTNPFSVYQTEIRNRNKKIYKKRSYANREGTHHYISASKSGLQYELESLFQRFF